MKDRSASSGAPPAGARWHRWEDIKFLSQDVITMSADYSKTHGSVLVFVSPASSSESLGIRTDVVDGRRPPKKCDLKLSSAPSSGHKSKKSANQWRADRPRWAGPTCSFSLGEFGRRQLQLQAAAHLSDRTWVQRTERVPAARPQLLLTLLE